MQAGTSATGQPGPIEEASASTSTDAGLAAIPVTACLFCPNISPDVEGNLQHMELHHDFKVSDLSFVTDMQGLLTYLGKKVGLYGSCLWCCHRSFPTTRAVQEHMIEKKHCKMNIRDDKREYSRFYEYSVRKLYHSLGAPNWEEFSGPSDSD